MLACQPFAAACAEVAVPDWLGRTIFLSNILKHCGVSHDLLVVDEARRDEPGVGCFRLYCTGMPNGDTDEHVDLMEFLSLLLSMARRVVRCSFEDGRS